MITLIISKSSRIFAIQIKYHKGNKLGKHPSFLDRSGEFSFPVSKKNKRFFLFGWDKDIRVIICCR